MRSVVMQRMTVYFLCPILNTQTYTYIITLISSVSLRKTACEICTKNLQCRLENISHACIYFHTAFDSY
jgi:transcription elongation factor Elf1